jgi:hypothetical protein
LHKPLRRKPHGYTIGDAIDISFSRSHDACHVFGCAASCAINRSTGHAGNHTVALAPAAPMGMLMTVPAVVSPALLSIARTTTPASTSSTAQPAVSYDGDRSFIHAVAQAIEHIFTCAVSIAPTATPST